MPEELELESRRTIYQRIVDDPGIHFRALLETLPYAQGTLQYHLRDLVSRDYVDAESDGRYTRYYPADDFEAEDRRVMNALRRKRARHIAAFLASEGELTTTDLAARLDTANSTVSWHLSRLQEAGLVDKERDGRSVYYRLTDPERVRYLYTVHRQTFTDKLVDRLFDIWTAY